MNFRLSATKGEVPADAQRQGPARLCVPARAQSPAASSAGGARAQSSARVRCYARATGIPAPGFCAHSLRAAAATSAPDHGADIAKVQGWLGHANTATARLHDRRKTRPEDSPTFKVAC